LQSKGEAQKMSSKIKNVLSLGKRFKNILQITYISHIRFNPQQAVAISLDRKTYVMMTF